MAGAPLRQLALDAFSHAVAPEGTNPVERLVDRNKITGGVRFDTARFPPSGVSLPVDIDRRYIPAISATLGRSPPHQG
jgi:hypothetical protein